MLPLNQGDIKNAALESGRHQICNPLDSFDLRCESVTYSEYYRVGILYYCKITILSVTITNIKKNVLVS